MTRWFPMQPCDSSFFESAPHVYRYLLELPVPPERVWESLTSTRSVADWSPLLASAEWTSPLGPGASRTVVLPFGSVTVHEHFFRWEEGRRYSFYVREANRPLLTRLAEDYLVEPSGAGTRFTWTFALEGNRGSRWPLKALHVPNRVLFGQMAQGARRYFESTAR